MKNKIELEKQLGKFREIETETLRSISNDINNITENPQITEDSLRKLENIVRQLAAIKETHNWRLIKLLKQNHTLD
jgi:mevalonate kinase